jgi:LacI family transcriptional regulator
LLALEEQNFPTVLIGQAPDTGFCSVDVDNYNAARQAVEHLIDLGHARIACITNAPVSYTAAADRLAGYREAVVSAGLSYDPDLVRFGDFDPESGYLQMQNLLQADTPFTAAFVASDVVAVGAQAAAHERGLRIPDDLALVGFDDLPLARFVDPPLTTVHLPAVELAQRACELLIGLIKGEVPPITQVLLPTHLVVRRSSGARRENPYNG